MVCHGFLTRHHNTIYSNLYRRSSHLHFTPYIQVRVQPSPHLRFSPRRRPTDITQTSELSLSGLCLFSSTNPDDLYQPKPHQFIMVIIFTPQPFVLFHVGDAGLGQDFSAFCT